MVGKIPQTLKEYNNLGQKKVDVEILMKYWVNIEYPCNWWGEEEMFTGRYFQLSLKWNSYYDITRAVYLIEKSQLEEKIYVMFNITS